VKLWLDEVDMGGVTAGVFAAIRATFRRETLPPAPPPEPRHPAGGGLLHLLFAPEPLPPAPPTAPAAPSGPGLVATLFAPEPLPVDLPPAPVRAGRWFSWLLAAEPLDP
jgi:hypothetical protein